MTEAPTFWRRRYPGTAPPFFSKRELDDVAAFYRNAADAPASPLRHLPRLARELGLGDLIVKDESSRFGLPAFKIVGVRYALGRLVAKLGATLTDVACATAGNHGRAAARAAKDHALDAHVYVPIGTARSTVDALLADGAHVVVTSVGYDDTVRLMAEDAAEFGWTVLSDTAWEGYEQVPRWIMAGYTWIFDEAVDQLGADRPGVVVVQAGVGSFAGAAAGWLVERHRVDRPRLVVVEPSGSACVMASLREGRRVNLGSCEPTSMVGLRCAEVSSLAWPALEPVVDAAIAIPDSAAEAAIRRLGDPRSADPPIHAGPSGAAGVAALILLMSDPSLEEVREALDLGPSTRVLTVVTEGPGN